MWPCNRFNKFLDDVVASDDESEEIISLGYSSGNSSESDMIVIQKEKEWSEMNRDERDNHSFVLWRRLTQKLKGSVTVINSFSRLNRRMFLSGTTKSLAFLNVKEKKPHWWLIQPNTKLNTAINTMSHLLLVYTAIVVPYQVAFLSETDTPDLDFFDRVVNYLFQIDFLLNFVTAVEVGNRIEQNLC